MLRYQKFKNSFESFESFESYSRKIKIVNFRYNHTRTYYYHTDAAARDDVQRRQSAAVSQADGRTLGPKFTDNNGHRVSNAEIAVSRKGFRDVSANGRDAATTAVRHHGRRVEPRVQFLSGNVFQKVNYILSDDNIN